MPPRPPSAFGSLLVWLIGKDAAEGAWAGCWLFGYVSGFLTAAVLLLAMQCAALTCAVVLQRFQPGERRR